MSVVWEDATTPAEANEGFSRYHLTSGAIKVAVLRTWNSPLSGAVYTATLSGMIGRNDWLTQTGGKTYILASIFADVEARFKAWLDKANLMVKP